MEGRAERGEMREITMEDLLAREPADVDEVACRETIEGRVVLITGAAGSIGGELSRLVLSFNPAALHLVDTNETALQELRLELNAIAPPNCRIKPWLSSIIDRQKLQDLFEASRPQVVFHLAAYKYVAVMEEHPDQAFETNVLGTLNVFEAAQAVDAERVAFLSSHTAVNPSGVYGASKRTGELLVQSMPESRTRLLEAVKDRASPITYVSSDDAPFLHLHGDQDRLVDLAQSEALHRRLVAAGVESELIVVKNAGHSFVPSGGPISPSLEELAFRVGEFFDHKLIRV